MRIETAVTWNQWDCDFSVWHDFHCTGMYPLVNLQKAMERSTIFNGKIHYFDWAIFHCYVSSPEGTPGCTFFGWSAFGWLKSLLLVRTTPLRRKKRAGVAIGLCIIWWAQRPTITATWTWAQISVWHNGMQPTRIHTTYRGNLRIGCLDRQGSLF